MGQRKGQLAQMWAEKAEQPLARTLGMLSVGLCRSFQCILFEYLLFCGWFQCRCFGFSKILLVMCSKIVKASGEFFQCALLANAFSEGH